MMDHAHLGGTATREQVGELTILTPKSAPSLDRELSTSSTLLP
jgi:hypothetical protein